jgi:putative FmdB family regulatory protein
MRGSGAGTGLRVSRRRAIPLYDFRCEADHRFERFVPLADFKVRQVCNCGARAVRLIVAVRVHSDEMEPFRGPDGRMHTSLSGYRRSLLPSGNAQGERYTEIGNEEAQPRSRDLRAEQGERVEAIKRGIEDVKNGRVPTVTALED